MIISKHVETRRRFNVYATSAISYRRLIDLETTSFVYWKTCSFWVTVWDFSYFMLLSWDIQMVISIIFKSDDIITSISTRCRVHFWIYLVNRKLIGRKTWLTNRCRNGNIFHKGFAVFVGLNPKSRPFLIQQTIKIT